MCNPGDGDDIDNWESLATNKNQIKQKYDEKFSNKLNETLNNMLLPNTEDISPIFEMIKVVAVKAFPLKETINGHRVSIYMPCVRLKETCLKRQEVLVHLKHICQIKKY